MKSVKLGVLLVVFLFNFKMFVFASPKITDEQREWVIKKGEMVTISFMTDMKAKLSGAMKDGGPAHAVSYCATEAMPITQKAEQFAAEGISIKRSSSKFRNPQNAPDNYEKEALEYFESEMKAQGVLPKNFVQALSDGSFRYYKPLVIQSLCLNCHGGPGDIQGNVKAVLEEKYPEDLASGYSLGEFRGVVRVGVPAK